MESQTPTVINARGSEELYDAIVKAENFALQMRVAVRDQPVSDLPDKGLSRFQKQMSNELKGLDYNHACFMKTLDLENPNPNYEAAKTYLASTLYEITSEINSRGDK